MAVGIRHPEVQKRAPHNQGKKESGWDLAPGKEPWRGNCSCALGSPLTGQEVSLDRKWASETRKSTYWPVLWLWWQQAEDRPAKRIGATLLQYAAQDAHIPVHAGARCWNLGFRTGPGRAQVGYTEIAWRLKCDCRKSLGPPQQQSTIAKEHVKGWAWPAITASFIRSSRSRTVGVPTLGTSLASAAMG